MLTYGVGVSYFASRVYQYLSRRVGKCPTLIFYI